MKIDPNILSTMRDMLADPEKDWSDHLPFIQFEKASELFKEEN